MYIIIEIQKNQDNQIATLVNSYTDKNLAQQKYHQVLAAASVSSILIHSAVMLNEDGYLIKKQSYYHNIEPQEQQNEPQEN